MKKLVLFVGFFSLLQRSIQDQSTWSGTGQAIDSEDQALGTLNVDQDYTHSSTLAAGVSDADTIASGSPFEPDHDAAAVTRSTEDGEWLQKEGEPFSEDSQIVKRPGIGGSGVGGGSHAFSRKRQRARPKSHQQQSQSQQYQSQQYQSQQYQPQQYQPQQYQPQQSQPQQSQPSFNLPASSRGRLGSSRSSTGSRTGLGKAPPRRGGTFGNLGGLRQAGQGGVIGGNGALGQGLRGKGQVGQGQVGQGQRGQGQYGQGQYGQGQYGQGQYGQGQGQYGQGQYGQGQHGQGQTGQGQYGQGQTGQGQYGQGQTGQGQYGQGQTGQGQYGQGQSGQGQYGQGQTGQGQNGQGQNGQGHSGRQTMTVTRGSSPRQSPNPKGNPGGTVGGGTIGSGGNAGSGNAGGGPKGGSNGPGNNGQNGPSGPGKGNPNGPKNPNGNPKGPGGGKDPGKGGKPGGSAPPIIGGGFYGPPPVAPCACRAILCSVRGREACECHRAAAILCSKSIAVGCPAPYIEQCDNYPTWTRGPTPLPITSYIVTSTYIDFPEWKGNDLPPADYPFSTYSSVLTSYTTPPWWTPYNHNSPYSYPGYPSKPTYYPNPPPPPPPYNKSLTVSYPTVSIDTSTFAIGDLTMTTLEVSQTRVVTTITVLSSGTYTESVYIPYTGPDNHTGGFDPFNDWPAAMPDLEPTEPWSQLPPVTVTLPGKGTPMQTGSKSPKGTGACGENDGKSIITIPGETIAVPGGRTIMIPGSVVTVTGQWFPPGARSLTGAPPPRQSCQQTQRGAQTTKPAVGNTPHAQANGGRGWKPSSRTSRAWTTVRTDTPYTPGPERPKSTAFYEPPTIGNSPGVPLLEAPAKCGPNSPRCADGQYCDPQPLCDIGLACPGVCLPLYGGKYSQPDSVRGQIWDKVMAEGIYRVRLTVTEIRQVVDRI